MQKGFSFLFEWEKNKIKLLVIDKTIWVSVSDVYDALKIYYGKKALVNEMNRTDIRKRKISINNGTKKTETLMIELNSLMKVLCMSSEASVDKFRESLMYYCVHEIGSKYNLLQKDNLEEILYNPDVLIKLAHKLKEYEQELSRAKNTIKQIEILVKETIEKDVEEIIPKNKEETKENGLLIRDWAHYISSNYKINIGQNKLYKILRDMGYLSKVNQPYQRFIDEGLFVVKTSNIAVNNVHFMKNTTLVTNKGIKILTDKIVNKWKEMAEDTKHDNLTKNLTGCNGHGLYYETRIKHCLEKLKSFFDENGIKFVDIIRSNKTGKPKYIIFDVNGKDIYIEVYKFGCREHSKALEYTKTKLLDAARSENVK